MVTSTESLASTQQQDQHAICELKRNKNQMQSIHRPEQHYIEESKIPSVAAPTDARVTSMESQTFPSSGESRKLRKNTTTFLQKGWEVPLASPGESSEFRNNAAKILPKEGMGRPKSDSVYSLAAISSSRSRTREHAINELKHNSQTSSNQDTDLY